MKTKLLSFIFIFIGFSANAKTSYDYFNDGVKRLSKANYQKAVESFSKAIEKNNNYSLAYFMRAKSYQSNNPSAALADFDKAIALDSTVMDYYLERGVFKINQKDYQGALIDIEQADKIIPQFHECLYWKGVALYNLKKYTEAANMFISYEKSRKNYNQTIYGKTTNKNLEATAPYYDMDEKLMLFNCYYACSKEMKACDNITASREYAAQAIDIPQSKRIDSNQYDEMKTLAGDTKSIIGSIALCESVDDSFYLSGNQFRPILRDAANKVASAPEEPTYILFYAISLAKMDEILYQNEGSPHILGKWNKENHEKAILNFKKADALIAKSGMTHFGGEIMERCRNYYRGVAYYRLNDYWNAIPLFDKTTEFQKQDLISENAKEFLGNSLSEMHFYRDAVEAYKGVKDVSRVAAKIIALDKHIYGSDGLPKQYEFGSFPNNVLLTEGSKYFQDGYFYKAIKTFKKSIENTSLNIDSEDAWLAYVALSNAYIKLNNSKAGLDILSEYIAKIKSVNNQRFANALMYIGGCYHFSNYQIADNNKALEYYLAAINSGGLRSNLECYHYIGDCYFLLKQYDAALKYYKMLPDNYGYGVKGSIAEIENIQRGEIQKQIEQAQKITDSKEYEHLAMKYYSMNEINEASKYADLALAIRSTADMNYIKARYILHKMNWPRASTYKGEYNSELRNVLYYCNRAVADGNCTEMAELYFARGYANGMLRNSTDAISDYHAALRLNPNIALANFNLGISYYNTENYENALIYFKKARELGTLDKSDESDNFDMIRKCGEKLENK